MRWSIFLLPLVLGQCTRSSVPAAMTPPRETRLTITATPVALYSERPGDARIGALTYLGGWHLSSPAPAFGGLSSLTVIGQHFTAVTDAGGLVSFNVGRFGHVSHARVRPLPVGCGSGSRKADHDSESLTQDPTTGKWWVGFEWRNAICRMSGDFTVGERVNRPPPMMHWRETGGAETLLRLSDGRFLVIAEKRSSSSGALRHALLFDRDPSNPAAHATQLRYRSPQGFNPTDAAQLPDGRLLILNRNFSLASLFTVVLTIVDPAELKPGGELAGRVIARFQSPAIPENYEGIAVTVEEGQPIVWIVSDNNFAAWQRTLLLKFAFSEQVSPAALPQF